jgi:hypothetical protein
MSSQVQLQSDRSLWAALSPSPCALLCRIVQLAHGQQVPFVATEMVHGQPLTEHMLAGLPKVCCEQWGV